MHKNLFNFIDNCQDLVFELQKGLTSYPAISPGEEGGIGEWEKANWLEQKLISLGINNITRIDADDQRAPSGKRPNILATIPGKSEKKLWIMCHLDVVPPGEIGLWKTNPYEAVLDENDNDIIRGRGVEDNQQSLVSAVLIAKALLETNTIPDYTLALLFLADEETHNTYGIDHVLKTKPDLIDKNDLVLVPDFGSSNNDLIEIAEKCLLWIKITVLGKQCHASTPDDAINSLIVSSEFILRLHEVEKTLNKRNSLFKPDRTTITPTKYEGNIPNINTIPGKEIFYIDCRILPDYQPQDVLDEINKLAEDVAKKYGAEIKAEIISAELSTQPTDPNSEVAQKLKQSIKQINNIDCEFCGAGGGTVASRVRKLNIPAAVYASGFPNYHQPNEGSRISYTINDAKIFANLLFEKIEGETTFF